jgi:hypothetical protein
MLIALRGLITTCAEQRPAPRLAQCDAQLAEILPQLKRGADRLCLALTHSVFEGELERHVAWATDPNLKSGGCAGHLHPHSNTLADVHSHIESSPRTNTLQARGTLTLVSGSSKPHAIWPALSLSLPLKLAWTSAKPVGYSHASARERFPTNVNACAVRQPSVGAINRAALPELERLLALLMSNYRV